MLPWDITAVFCVHFCQNLTQLCLVMLLPASWLVPLRHCGVHSIPSPEHTSAGRGVTSPCPLPSGHTCQDHLNICLWPRWPPTPRPAQPANHPSRAVPPQRGPTLIKHEAETTKYVKTHLKFIVSYHTFESLERWPVFLPLRDGAYLLSPTLRVDVQPARLLAFSSLPLLSLNAKYKQLMENVHLFHMGRSERGEEPAEAFLGRLLSPADGWMASQNGPARPGLTLLTSFRRSVTLPQHWWGGCDSVP